MPGCVLRIESKTSAVDDLVRVSGSTPCAVFRKGEPKVPGSTVMSRTSGFNVVVSDADGIAAQARDASRFLTHHAQGLGRLRRHAAFVSMSLDFGLYYLASPEVP